MRIIAGDLRGHKLRALEGDAVRPTPNRVKEALFNILQFQVEGRVFLDLFAGSGQMGIEAISRGAQAAVFVDLSKKAIGVVEENLRIIGAADKGRVYNADSAVFIAHTAERFDVAFLDPPYETELLAATLPLVAACMNQGGIILCEHPREVNLPEKAGDFCQTKRYRYGKIFLTAYRHVSAVEGRDAQ